MDTTHRGARGARMNRGAHAARAQARGGHLQAPISHTSILYIIMHLAVPRTTGCRERPHLEHLNNPNKIKQHAVRTHDNRQNPLVLMTHEMREFARGQRREGRVPQIDTHLALSTMPTEADRAR